MCLINCGRSASDSQPVVTLSKEAAGKQLDRLDLLTRAIGIATLALLATTIIFIGVASAGKISPNFIFYSFLGCASSFLVTKIAGNYADAFAETHGINRMARGYQKRHPSLSPLVKTD